MAPISQLPNCITITNLQLQNKNKVIISAKTYKKLVHKITCYVSTIIVAFSQVDKLIQTIQNNLKQYYTLNLRNYTCYNMIMVFMRTCTCHFFLFNISKHILLMDL